MKIKVYVEVDLDEHMWRAQFRQAQPNAPDLTDDQIQGAIGQGTTQLLKQIPNVRDARACVLPELWPDRIQLVQGLSIRG